MATKRQEHNAKVLENEMNKLHRVYRNSGQISWHVMKDCYMDRYRCLVCLKRFFNPDFFYVSYLWQYTFEGDVYKEVSKLGKICSPACCNDAKIRTMEADKLSYASRVNGFDQKAGIKIQILINPKKHYVCKGCRTRKKTTDPFMTIGFQYHAPDDRLDKKNSTYFFGRTCSEECYNLMVFKMMQK